MAQFSFKRHHDANILNDKHVVCTVKCWRHGCNHVVFNVKLGHAALILNRLLRLCLCLCLCSEFAKSLICHNKRYIQLSQSRPCTGEVHTRHEYWNLYVTMLWSYHIVESSGCKHGGKRCSLLWQKRQNSSKISMDRLIKRYEKTSVSNIIHVSYIRS